jgi:hypothetical protein
LNTLADAAALAEVVMAFESSLYGQTAFSQGDLRTSGPTWTSSATRTSGDERGGQVLRLGGMEEQAAERRPRGVLASIDAGSENDPIELRSGPERDDRNVAEAGARVRWRGRLLAWRCDRPARPLADVSYVAKSIVSSATS